MPHYTEQQIEVANNKSLVAFLNSYGEQLKKGYYNGHQYCVYRTADHRSDKHYRILEIKGPKHDLYVKHHCLYKGKCGKYSPDAHILNGCFVFLIHISLPL